MPILRKEGGKFLSQSDRHANSFDPRKKGCSCKKDKDMARCLASKLFCAKQEKLLRGHLTTIIQTTNQV